MIVKLRLPFVILLILVALTACTTIGNEPSVSTPESESTVAPELISTEEPTATWTLQPTATPEPTTPPIPTDIPVPTETPIPTRTPVPRGTVKGCVYWTDGSKAEGFIKFNNDLGNLPELETMAIGGCFSIKTPAGRYEIQAGLSDRPECGAPAFCGSPRTIIEVPPNGVVEIDFYPEPLNQD